MAKQYHIKCIVCNAAGTFDDTIDIRQAKWKVIGWDVKNGDPKCICEKCEYTGCIENKSKK